MFDVDAVLEYQYMIYGKDIIVLHVKNDRRRYFVRKRICILQILCAVALSLILLDATAMAMGGKPGVPQINISGQEARLTPVVGVGSIFMKIENSGSGDDSLVGARASIPGTSVELHDVKDGKMVKTEKIAVPSKSIVELKPRSIHLMILNMPDDIREGSEFSLYLKFEKSGEKQVLIKFVKKTDASMHHHH